jgi:hypothetical protein
MITGAREPKISTQKMKSAFASEKKKKKANMGRPNTPARVCGAGYGRTAWCIGASRDTYPRNIFFLAGRPINSLWFFQFWECSKHFWSNFLVSFFPFLSFLFFILLFYVLFIFWNLNSLNFEQSQNLNRFKFLSISKFGQF